MNFHSDEWVQEQLVRHKDFARTLYQEDKIVGIFCQGSTNYGLDTETSDFDTKCIVVPSFKDIALAKKPVSTTHILPNDEHCDGKDIRLYIETFRKQNLNFLEILFTKYFKVNPIYFYQWMRLVHHKEEIAHMNPYRAIKSMKGIAMEKFHAMEHSYPSKIEIIKKYGYDGKQTHHLIRIDDFITRFINGEPYSECLKPSTSLVDELFAYKLHKIPYEVARKRAKQVLEHVTTISDKFCEIHSDSEDMDTRNLLEDVSYNIMKIAVMNELNEHSKE